MLKNIKEGIWEDVQNVFKKDPAARNIFEVIFFYPGLHAIWMHRAAHFFWNHRFYFLARFISHLGRFATGIEIHPGARIGRRFFIDHGAGVVIGETTDIGDDVLLYQGVVLGGVSLKKEKRHPTIGNRVLVGAGTIVLGPIHIGDGTRIGAASLVVKDVPANAIAVGVPARIGMGFSARELTELGHNKLPDPIADAFKFLGKQIDSMEERLEAVEQLEGIKVDLDKYVEQKKREILDVFSQTYEFDGGAGI
ncbi:MAG: serine O-acetyltransferase [Syntrophobacterales bacterium]|nr:serine O-acetyltransferase [Syntrophobacterales bacterium]